MITNRQFWWPVLAGVVLLGAACSGDEGTGPDGEQTVSGSVSGDGGVSYHQVDVERGSSMTITISWSGDNDLDLYLTPTSCTSAMFVADLCQILEESEGTGNSESVNRSVSDGQSFKAWVVNWDSGTVNYSLKLKIR